MRVATQGALWGAVSAHGFLCDAVVVSDDAGQFDIGTHALCRIHIPRHTDGSQNHIRCHVIKRAVSAGTRSDTGRDCGDAFLDLAKTCRCRGQPA